MKNIKKENKIWFLSLYYKDRVDDEKAYGCLMDFIVKLQAVKGSFKFFVFPRKNKNNMLYFVVVIFGVSISYNDVKKIWDGYVGLKRISVFMLDELIQFLEVKNDIVANK